MSEAAKTLRLSKVAKEFNLSLGKIVEFLALKGHKTESNPNAKIGDEEYRLLLKEFSSDKSAREEAEHVSHQVVNKLKRETIVLDELKAKRHKDEEMDEVVIKDLTAPKNTVAAPEKAEPKRETITKAESSPLDGPKVLGKLDLDTLNLKTKPEKKVAKKEPEQEPVSTKVEETPEIVEEAPVETAPTEGTTKEEPKEEFLKTRYEKLEGPKILGTIELPDARDAGRKSPSMQEENRHQREWPQTRRSASAFARVACRRKR
jgi:translation initiation factor IF-2